MRVNAQVSVYPLRQQKLSPAIDEVGTALKQRDLDPKVGPLSTFVTGDSEEIFGALREAFERDASEGAVVMHVTIGKASD